MKPINLLAKHDIGALSVMRLFITLVLVLLAMVSIGRTTPVCSKEDKFFEPVLRQSTFDSLFPTAYTMYAVGEYHYHKENEAFQLAVIPKLITERNLGGIVLENGAAHAFLMRVYLRTGNEKFLRNVSLTPTEERFFRSLRLILKDLGRTETFRVYGIDYEDYRQNTFVAIVLGIRAFEHKDSTLTALSEELTPWIYIDDYWEREEFYHFFEETLPLYPRLAKRLEMIRNAYMVRADFLRKNFQKDNPLSRKREDFLAANLARIIKANPSRVLFGQFGAMHTTNRPNSTWLERPNWTSMVALANAELGRKTIHPILFIANLGSCKRLGLTDAERKDMRSAAKRTKLAIIDLRKYHVFNGAVDWLVAP